MVAKKGGRIPPDGRPAQAPGIGKNAKRHDLERPKTPGLHGSDLQQGDVQAMEQGQRVAPAQQQGQGHYRALGTAAPNQGRDGARPLNDPRQFRMPPQIPDPISFLAGRNGPNFNMPQGGRRLDASKAMTWLPILRHLASGPGASSALVNAFINQARRMRQAGGQPAFVVDLNAADDGIEAMLDEMQA